MKLTYPQDQILFLIECISDALPILRRTSFLVDEVEHQVDRNYHSTYQGYQLLIFEEYVNNYISITHEKNAFSGRNVLINIYISLFA